MHLPKVSVVVPNYNHAGHLRQRIQSVLQQTYPNFEVILLDDCSTDDSQLIINSYKDHPRVACIKFNETNSGSPFKQWQKGIELSTGEWIWLAESDDYADERFLQIMISALPNQHNVGLLYCDSNIVCNDIVSDETFATLKNKRFKTNRWSENYSNNGASEIENFLLPGGTINNTSAVLFNKKAFTEADPFDVVFKYIGDKYTFIKVLAKTDVIYVKESLNYYRDPFNTRHADKYVFYFYEQFLVFDWVLKNLKISDQKKFAEGFYSNTSNSLFRDWNHLKFSLYKKLLKKNPRLLLKSISNNMLRSFRSIIDRVDRTI